MLLALSEREAAYLSEVPHAGLLVAAGDPTDLQRNFTLSAPPRNWERFGSSSGAMADMPALWISEELAGQILAS